ncbi:hypothetical protein CsSME_00038837 [Camellia sinensis var. sinensis]
MFNPLFYCTPAMRLSVVRSFVSIVAILSCIGKEFYMAIAIRGSLP